MTRIGRVSKWVRPRRYVALVVVVVVVVAACSAADGDTASSDSSLEPYSTMAERLDLIDEAVAQWEQSESIAEANTWAETAANLIVGPNGPGYGDRDGDGVTGGQVEAGLLPGLDGTPEGIAVSQSSNPCVARDVLGGSWEDPSAAWEEMRVAIDDWEPGRNTMPTLASHPMRIVGWATFTIESDSLDEAHEYGGHARLHVDVSQSALDC